jgi:hypothetical protein
MTGMCAPRTHQEHTMKLPSLSVIAMSLLLAAGPALADAPARADRHAPVKPEVDVDKVMLIETAAQRNGVRVHWIHPPQVDAAKARNSERTYRFRSKRQSQS